MRKTIHSRWSHLYTLISLLPLSHSLCGAVEASTIGVTWISPVDGDVYASGDLIIGQWQASKAITSPSFKLCSTTTRKGRRASDSCGDTVRPTVEQTAGSYLVSLVVPNIASQINSMYLQMEDTLGKTARSPTFTLNPSLSSSSLGADEDSPNTISTIDPPFSMPAPTYAMSSGNNVIPTPTLTMSHISATSRPSSISPFLATAHTSPSTAAIAVPLSLVGIVVIAGVALAIYHHRNLARERSCDSESLKRANSCESRKAKVDTMNMTQSLGNFGKLFEIQTHNSSDFSSDVKLSSRQAIREPFHLSDSKRTPHCDPTGVALYPEEILHDVPLSSPTSPYSVISRYFQSSPAMVAEHQLSPPLALHSRREANLSGDSMRFVARYDKPLPKSPTPARSVLDLYDIVARAMGRI